jgi:hypothetical protein
MQEYRKLNTPVIEHRPVASSKQNVADEPVASSKQNVADEVCGSLKRTVICHFYNEEWLLPFWLQHHSKLFDHGIMIDYHSTDRSREIIKEICPTWEIRTTKNNFFDSTIIDREVETIEKEIVGWRICLNVTEFLYGNYSHLTDTTKSTRYFIGNYVFVDMLNRQPIDNHQPLHIQRTWGYKDRFSTNQLLEGSRPRRSLHNYPIFYPKPGGRHYNEPASFNDLYIFYYGYAVLDENGVKRKTQIQGKMSPTEQKKLLADHPNKVTEKSFLDKIDKYIRPKAKDITDEIQSIIKFNY